MFNFEKLEIYQLAIDLAIEIYTLTRNFPRSEQFGLTDQLKRAAVSVPANIAEGSSRKKKEFTHFLNISLGSCFEIIAFLQISQKVGFLKKIDYDSRYKKICLLCKMINSFKNTLR